jgi:hypothetical protein
VKRLRGVTASRPRVIVGLAAVFVTGCAAPRIVPVPAAGVQIDGAARGLTLEFHYRLGELPRVLTLLFQVERDGGGAPGG